MPYIGTTPTKVVSRQSANVYRYEATAGQTAFTGADLDNNVLACNPADMIVHMNGLRLESTDYTATSTTVTLTTAATAGDEVTVTSFVTFEVADTYTKTAADTRYVNTTGDTMTGALALPAGGLTVGTDQLAVDSAGRVTMPYQPAFSASRNSGNVLAGSNIIFNDVHTNVGNHYNASTGKFTAPIDGLYQINYFTLGDNTTVRNQVDVMKNGVVYFQLRDESKNGLYDTFSISLAFPLSAGDAIHCYVNSGEIYGSASSWNVFSGYLIG